MKGSRRPPRSIFTWEDVDDVPFSPLNPCLPEVVGEATSRSLADGEVDKNNSTVTTGFFLARSRIIVQNYYVLAGPTDREKNIENVISFKVLALNGGFLFN